MAAPDDFKHISIDASAYGVGDKENTVIHGAALMTVHNEDECEGCAAMSDMVRGVLREDVD